MARHHFRVSSADQDPSTSNRAPMHTLAEACIELDAQGGAAAGRCIWRARASADGTATIGGWKRLSADAPRRGRRPSAAPRAKVASQGGARVPVLLTAEELAVLDELRGTAPRSVYLRGLVLAQRGGDRS